MKPITKQSLAESPSLNQDPGIVLGSPAQANKKKQESSPSVIHLSLKDKTALYSAYMPFVKGGGLFLKGEVGYAFGEEVFVLLTLMEETEKLHVAGKVIWVTPSCAQGGKQVGVGIQFDPDHEETVKIRNLIETYLGGTLKSDNPTDTL